LEIKDSKYAARRLIGGIYPRAREELAKMKELK
jgi:hypothetical protein